MPTIQIKISGHLDMRWQTFFEDFTLSHHIAEDQTPFTILAGYLPDQSAVYGILTRLRNLGASLISLESTDLEEMN